VAPIPNQANGGQERGDSGRLHPLNLVGEEPGGTPAVSGDVDLHEL